MDHAAFEDPDTDEIECLNTRLTKLTITALSPIGPSTLSGMTNQVLRPSNSHDSAVAKSQGNITYHASRTRGDKLLLLIVSTSICLINTCSIAELDNIQRKLPESFLVLLKDLWVEEHKRKLFHRPPDLENVSDNDLAEGIFRLSMNDPRSVTTFQFTKVKQRVFGLNDHSFKDFITDHWEAAPYLRRAADSIDKGDMFYAILKSFNASATTPFLFSNLLPRLVSCISMASQDLEILERVKGKLGCSIIYQQDIRVIMTNKILQREVHFFPVVSTALTMDDIRRCEEAYVKGFTTALRGMEIRSNSVASVANALAILFGQPSVGANLYLTPPCSQGLMRHYDDHCVFLFQLLGSKQWRVSSQPAVRMPRLYEPLCDVNVFDLETSVELLLEEGDILYIPRGFSHEASTKPDTSGSADGLSLHLTLSIEIEPPFEWEGFIHVALCCWYGSWTPEQSGSLDGSSVFMYLGLLHIRLLALGECDPAFRKACLIGAHSSESVTDKWLDCYQRNAFSQLIDRIRIPSAVAESTSFVDDAMQKDDDPFRRIRWLEFVDMEVEDTDTRASCVQVMRTENFECLSDQANDKVQAAFEEVKNKFCHEAEFGRAKTSYLCLLEKYRKTRNQYRNGMLSLHHSLEAMNW